MGVTQLSENVVVVSCHELIDFVFSKCKVSQVNGFVVWYLIVIAMSYQHIQLIPGMRAISYMTNL